MINKDNFKYIDCVSGLQPLIDLYYTDEWKMEDFQRATRIFENCFRNGAVFSNCGRRVISTKKFLENAQKAIEECNEFLCYVYTSKILEAALRAVWDPFKNCAIGQGESYLPKE